MKIDESSGISVVVCCFNSASRIVETMRHLALQKVVPSIPWEVVIVDNNCSDDTVVTAQRVWDEQLPSGSLRIVEETQPGQSYARMTGVRAAAYDCLIFCDDDNWLVADYLQNAYDLLLSKPEVGVCGGRGVAASNVEFPVWFTAYQRDYAVGAQALESSDVTERGYVWGAGMVVRRVVLLELLDADFSFLCSGRAGGKLLSGDDAEMCHWFVLAGYRLWYCENLEFTHFLAEGRLTVDYYKRLKEGMMASMRYLNAYKRAIRYLGRQKRRRRRYLLAAHYCVLQRLFRALGCRSCSERYAVKFTRLFPQSTLCPTEDIVCLILRNALNYRER